MKEGGDERLWVLEFARSAVTGCFSSANISRAVLQTNEKILIYRGYDQSDITAISQETSVLWHHVQMPTVYLVDNWPVRSVVISPDGRYVAIAGRRVWHIILSIVEGGRHLSMSKWSRICG